MRQLTNSDYQHLLTALKEKIQKARVKAILSVNAQLLAVYWEIGTIILEQQKNEGWGAKIIDRLAADLKIEFPDETGFSVRNLKYMRAFAEAYTDFITPQPALLPSGKKKTGRKKPEIVQAALAQTEDSPIVQGMLAQLTWYHHITLLDKVKEHEERLFYISKAIENCWSRSVMVLQIESNLYERNGITFNNFVTRLPVYSFVIYLFLFCIHGYAQANRNLEKQLSQAERKYAKNKYRDAIDIYTKYPDALSNIQLNHLAHIYLKGGSDVERNITLAVATYKKSAEKGNIEAMERLGTLYSDSSSGLTVDYTLAVAWLMKAHHGGDLHAWLTLAHLYKSGLGVAQSDSMAFDFYRQGEEREKESGVAQYCLGYAYSNGIWVKRDFAIAFDWYTKAAEKGYVEAMRIVGFMYRDGKGVGQDYNKALYWYKRAVKNGSITAMSDLGAMYAEGHSVRKDYATALKWFRRAADSGNSYGMKNIGKMYEQGLSVSPDTSLAMEWYRKSADLGNEDAMVNIGDLYRTGNRKLDRNCDEVVKWYLRAAAHESRFAMYRLGMLYEYGDCVAKNIDEARGWYFKASERGLKEAQDKYKRLQE